MFYDGKLSLGPDPSDITTTELDILLLGQLSRNGFALGMPCMIEYKAIGDVPTLTITKNEGLTFNMQASGDLTC